MTLPRRCLAVILSLRLPYTSHSDSHDISSFFPPAAPQPCGTPNAVPSTVCPCHGIAGSFCDQRAREHSRHEDMALDGGHDRVNWHGNVVYSYPDVFLHFILLSGLDAH
jgi:hypothetical protein